MYYSPMSEYSGSTEQIMAQAQLDGADIRLNKRLVFWPTFLFAGVNPTLTLVGAGGIGYFMGQEAQVNKITGQAADSIHKNNPEHDFASDVKLARFARRTSRVLATGLFITAGFLAATGIASPAALAAFAAAHAALIAGGLGGIELGWVGAKTVENVSNHRANRAARRLLGR